MDSRHAIARLQRQLALAILTPALLAGVVAIVATLFGA